MIHTDYAISRLKSYLNETGLAKSRLATIAGVPEGCIRNIDSSDWNPTSETLRKLELAIPKNFIPKKTKPKRST